MIYVLTHEYPDKSAVHICGVTLLRAVAEAWYNASDETNIYSFGTPEIAPENWIIGKKGWRQEELERTKR